MLGHDGQIIHDVNCTWCRFLLCIKKGIDGKYELEMCSLTRRKIPGPKEGNRRCAEFRQEGCPCDRCNYVPTGTIT